MIVRDEHGLYLRVRLGRRCRETAAERDYWTMQDQGLDWFEFASMEAWRG